MWLDEVRRRRRRAGGGAAKPETVLGRYLRQVCAG